jgi:DNA-binding transcriptional regulator YhcF (GntR family)
MAYPRVRQPTANELLWFRQARERLDEQRAEQLRAHFARVPMSERMAEELGAVVDRHTCPPVSTFCYLGPFTMHSDRSLVAIVRWIRRNSKYPVLAPDLYVTMCSLIVAPDGRVNATREQLAEMLGVSVGTVARAIAELVRQGYVLRDLDGRRAVYRINPRAASKAEQPDRVAAQAKAPPLLTLMEGGRLDDE